MAMAPSAHPDSGLVHYQARKRWALPFLAWHLICAQLQREVPRFISDYGAANRVAVEGDQPFPVQIDGDYWGQVRGLEVEILPAAARIIAPRTSPPRA
jgi:diacylglycerol kinase family enzyme